MSKKIGLRQAVKLAEDHAMGILEATDDGAYWGEEFLAPYEEDGEWKILVRARQIILNRIRKTK